MGELGLERWSFDNLSYACATTLQMWVIKKGLDSLVPNDLLFGFQMNGVSYVLVLEINKQCGQSVLSSEDPYS